MDKQSTSEVVVLVVEDEAFIRFDLVEVLEQAGYVAVGAACAAEAIRMLDANPNIRVVFTDVQMPGTLDGIALALLVRERWPLTIIVVSSGRVEIRPGDLPPNVLALSKPYDPHRLRQVLADIAARLA